jgi:hypothetical protein
VRLNITVEGQTEETFVKDLLAPYLGRRGVWVYVRRVLTGTGVSPFNGSRGYQFRGGMDDYQKPRRDIAIWTRQERGDDVRFTTMFDLYRLPTDWPGWLPGEERPGSYEYIEQLETAFAEDLGDERFIPYIQLHEFEALLFSHPEALLTPHPSATQVLSEIADAVEQCGGPELVNDGAETHPSRRLQALIPAYDKSVSGPEAAAVIGIDRMRDKCPHFDEWVGKLVDLGE